LIGEIFFTIFIWPIRFLLEFIFVLFIRIFSQPGSAVVFLSIVVSMLCLPLYSIADRWRNEEQMLQKKMKKKLDDIRAVFKGDTRQMIINTYYRQMGYSPVFMLKSSAGLLLQIPFFIAAYHFLSRTSMLSGVSFLFIPDLNTQDELIKMPFTVFGISYLNLMPFIMTFINLLSSFIYAKDMGKNEYIKLFLIAFVFLLLLYNMSSGLVLYWTMNNLFSLVKNTVIRYVKNPKMLLKIAAVLTAAIFLIFIWSGKANVERYRLMFTFFALLLALVPVFWNKIALFIEKFKKDKEITDDKIEHKGIKELYIWSFIFLFLLIGFLNPAQVLSASVSDFNNPWVFLFRTFIQGLSLFILVPLFIRAFASKQIRKITALGAGFFALNSLICYFFLFTYYGVMDRNFKLDDTNLLLNAFPLWTNIISIFISVIITIIFIKFKKELIFAFIFKILSGAIFILGIINVVIMQEQYFKIEKEINQKDNITKPVFNISKTQNNIFIISLDRAQGSAFYDALDYLPELKSELDGFVFFPNTLSYSVSTVVGVPSMLGGYNYTPLEINKRENETLVDKVNEAIKTIPRLFSEAGFRVTITDPVIANMQSVPDISIFKNMENVNAYLLSGRLSDRFLNEFPSNNQNESLSFDFDILLRYGIFRIAPPALRYGIYYKGQWWREAAYNSYGRAIGEFSSLYYLNDLCSIDNGEPAINIMLNFITHEGGNYNKNYFPQQEKVEFEEDEIKRFGSRENSEYIYIMLSAMKQIVKWFDLLKNEEVYDNTRILIISDHGGHYRTDSDKSGMGGYNPIYMIKDFNKRGELQINEIFMTNSDTPYLAAMNIPEINIDYIDAQNEKENIIKIVSLVSSQPLRHGPYRYNLNGVREMIGRKVLDNESWEDWERY